MKLITIPIIMVLVAGFSLSHAITSIPIDNAKASSTLLDKGKNTYRPENMIMKKNVHPFYQTWGATYQDRPITLEFTMGAQQVSVITLFNGNLSDSAAYENNSLAKHIRIYLNTKDNLVKKVVLAKPKWDGYKKTHADIIVFDKPLENVRKIIIEIEDIYPGRKWEDVFITKVKFWGFTKVLRKFEMGKMTDPRDGKKYNTVKIGEQTWMAQDLQYKTPGSRTFTNPRWKKQRPLPADAGLEYPEADINNGICPSGWRLPKASEFLKLKSELPPSASFDDFFATSNQKPFYAIYEYGNLGGDQVFPTDVEMFFYPTNAYGLNISTLTRHYYEGECAEDHAEFFAFSSYWTLDAKNIPLWPDDNGNVEVKKLRHYRFGGSDYCEAMLCSDDYHFVRCVKGDFMADPRDGQTYKTVKINDQTWMAENLRYETTESCCYDGMTENCAEQGRMYSWNAAQNACPEGWHLPSDTEFKALVESAGGNKTAGRLLKASTGWKNGNGTDEYGFSALPTGYCTLPANGYTPSEQAGEQAYLWTSSRSECPVENCESTSGLRFDVNSAGFADESGFDGTLALPIRCVKNKEPLD